MAYFHFKLGEDEVSTRLDKFLATELPQFSRSFLAKSQLLVNSKLAKPAQKIAAGDLIEVKIPPLKSLKILPEKISLEILFEDSEILVIVKPSGMVCHPTDHGGHVVGTLVNALLSKFKNLPGEQNRAGLVHRLDRETSGCLVVAKTELAKKNISQQFADRQVSKTYLALVVGKMQNPTGRIEAPIGRDSKNHLRRRISIASNSREAITEFQVIEEFPGASLLEVKILTGRTHQIRVHLSSLGHPVVGDSTYGFKNSPISAPRLFLHAWKLKFHHPKTGKLVKFSAPLPDDLEKVLRNLKP
ncbi:RluA family pseudouridine synthase [Candidatus Gracilibacteria bacterium]|nr:RluA family pseudouridine synthase [Candidatus Gracilibacteria bacterium]MCF7856347.1 RluA family pseudouridine synthase [Candidatus Gracilibacteria bacterium]MCF7896736.1 RluA family pseudouridine synthase [Candidatus Gracilibacteria bacterium]